MLALGADVRSLDVNGDTATARKIIGSGFDRVEWRIGDVSRADDVDAASRGCTAIIHIAGVLTPVCQANPVRGAQVNLIGTLNVFEAARVRRIAQVLYASSATVYGPNNANYPEPTSHYGAFKLAAEGCARAYWSEHRITSTALRPLVIYGPGRYLGPSAGVTLACRAIAEGKPYVIPFSGRSGFAHADDVAAAYEAALLHPREGAAAYNFWGHVVDTDEVVGEMKRIAPSADIRAQGNAIPVPADVESRAIYRDYPTLGSTSLHDGIAATIEFYRRN
jgi:nucleoside-diphosphate-sugar epimerase